MSIEIELQLWDAGKADERWLEWLEMSPEERANSEPEEQVESVLDIMEQPDAAEEWVTGRFAMLDLAFGQVGEPLHIRNPNVLESFARFFLVSFADCKPEDGKPPSYRLFLHPTYYERLLDVVTEEAIRRLVLPTLFTGESLLGMRRLFDPIELADDPSTAKSLADALVEFWNHIEPFFRQAVSLDSGHGKVVIFETVNGETDNQYLLDRGAKHAEWLRKTAEWLRKTMA